METHFIIDIETCPLELEKHSQLEEEEKLKLINPIDSKIVAIGLRVNNENKIFMDENEETILKNFWAEWKRLKQENSNCRVVGFNISNFDLPFIVSRSFINNVEIVPFVMKSITDIREKINAYRYGKTRGKLSDFGNLMGLEVSDMDGSKVADLWKEKKLDALRTYLEKDLELTDELFKRARATNILHIDRW
jgi:uncharacterized protein